MSVQSLDWEDPPEKEMATRPSILAWAIPWIEEQATVRGVLSLRHNLVTKQQQIMLYVIARPQ